MKRLMLDDASAAFDNGLPVLVVSQGTLYTEWFENTGVRVFSEMVFEFETYHGDVPAFYIDEGDHHA